jgi:2-polyprenyl-3-methyl-5-hydroxy-6-metoxy-1,4-benzoquinol methylase
MLHETSKILENGTALRLFKDYVKKKEDLILDVGSGNGFFLDILRRDGYKNCQALEVKDYGNPNAIIADISYHKLQFKDNQLGAVTAWEVMEHLENPYHAMREIHRILSPNGYFIFSMPNAFHWSNKFHFLFTGNFLRWNFKNDHRVIFTHDVFKKTYHKDFDLVDVKYSNPEFWQAKFQGPFRRMNRLFRKRLNKYFPKNQFFGHFIIYILKKK